MVSIVAFHALSTQETTHKIQKENRTVTLVNPSEYLNKMFRSFSLTHPGASMIYYTNTTTPPHIANARVVYFRGSSEDPILWRCEAWLDAVNSINDSLIFVDYDTLCLKELNHIFSDRLIIGFTYRNHPFWPINAGVIFVGTHSRPKAIKLFSRVLKFVKENSDPSHSCWGLDQCALREITGVADILKTRKITAKATFKHKGLTFFPCHLYNYSSPDNTAMLPPYEDQYILHFKGKRKKYMTETFNWLCEARSQNDALS